MNTTLDAKFGPSLPWDLRYEVKAVGLLALGFGLVNLDRFIINPLFPVIAKDLGLNYQGLGLVSAATALTIGIASIVTGQLSDRIGRKKVLVWSAVAFSLLVASTGLASGLISLLLIRSVMGVAEGAFGPASIVSVVEASKPNRIGLNSGLMQMAAPLIGVGLGPVIAIALLKVLPSWHWVFAVVAVPGLILSVLLALKLRESVPMQGVVSRSEVEAVSAWQLLRNKEIVFNALGMVCYITAIMALAAFMPNYLTDHLKLSLDQMSVVLSGIGLGSCIGMVVVPAISDRLGRRPVILVALSIALVALWLFLGIGAEPAHLFWTLFVGTAMIAGAIAITMGPLTSGAVPRHLAATATGMVGGIAEVFGGALSPALIGALADHVGIGVVPKIALGAVACGLLIAGFSLHSTKARR